MFDPPRSDTAATIREAGELGIKVKMLTGDAVAIAIETCKQLGVGTKVYDSEKLISGGGMSGSTIHDFVEAADGFGEVYPEHKYRSLSFSYLFSAWSDIYMQRSSPCFKIVTTLLL